jgi:protein-L-isoaspartate(D-aspartate) O-methyltransferase
MRWSASAALLDKRARQPAPVALPNVRLKLADGTQGLAQAAPFDTIIVAAAAAKVPPPLMAQLAPGGRMLLPLGGTEQCLCQVERSARGYVETRLDPVRFVPLVAGVE